MAKKRAKWAKQAAEFKRGLGGLDDAFEREGRMRDEHARERDAERRYKACESKNRYDSREEAEDVIADCYDHGRRGLSCYECPYCGGWHLTSKKY